MANAWVEFIRKWAKDNNTTYSCAVSLPACREAYQAVKPPKRKRLTQKKEREMMGREDVRAIGEMEDEDDTNRRDIISKGKTSLKAKLAKKGVEKQLVETVGMMGEEQASKSYDTKRRDIISKGKTSLKAKLAKKGVEKQLVDAVGMMDEDRDVADAVKTKPKSSEVMRLGKEVVDMLDAHKSDPEYLLQHAKPILDKLVGFANDNLLSKGDKRLVSVVESKYNAVLKTGDLSKNVFTIPSSSSAIPLAVSVAPASVGRGQLKRLSKKDLKDVIKQFPKTKRVNITGRSKKDLIDHCCSVCGLE